jgi:NAD(P)-dependent dehydrogenase (short-subunit alcohol dehydrogenase family)
MASTRNLSGKVVAISGGARGIGLAVAKAVHAAGARVAIGDIDEAGVQRAAREIGPGVFATHLDVTDPDSFRSFLAAATEALGPIDVLDNNAGIMPIGPFLSQPSSTVRRELEINVLGCMNGMQAALPAMLARGSGHILNTASMAGKGPVPGGLVYCATKAAVIHATETARVEFAGTGVEFTCVMPSFTNTDLVSGTKGTRFVKNVEPEDVAAAILRAIAKPKADVYVPRELGAFARVQPLIGRRVRDAINRGLRVDRAFLEVDDTARSAYEQRAAGAEPKQKSV